MGEPRIVFAISGLPRSGTTVLSRTLDGLSDVRCYGELLNTKKLNDEFSPIECYSSYASETLRPWKRRLRPVATRIQYLDDLLVENAGEEAATGFKLMDTLLACNAIGNRALYWLPWSARYLRSKALQDWLRKADVRIIHCIRENILELLISNIVARQTGLYHSQGPVSVSTDLKLSTTGLVMKLRQLSRGQEAAVNFYKELPTMTIRYEDAWDTKMRQVGRFLGLDGIEGATPALTKLANNDLSSRLANFHEVAEHLRHTEFGWMLRS